MYLRSSPTGVLLDKVHPNGTSNGAVGEGITDITPVVWQATAYIVIHTPEEAQRTQSPPSGQVVVRIRDGRSLPVEIRFRHGNWDEEGNGFQNIWGQMTLYVY